MVDSNSSDSSIHSAELDQLAALLREKTTLLQTSPNAFPQIQKLVDLEIWRIRQKLFQDDFSCDLDLPQPEGDITIITEKMFLPRKEYPDFNFVGRIIGPRGMTAKQLERATGCKIMIRGKGSMRDVRRSLSSPRGRSNYDHLEEDLHILIQCEDTPNRVAARVEKAKELINKIIVPASILQAKGADDLKRKQLIELAILNGTYREKHDTSTMISPLSPISSPYITRGHRSSPSLSPPSVGSSFGSPPTPSFLANSSEMDAANWIWRELRVSTGCTSSKKSGLSSVTAFPFCTDNPTFRMYNDASSPIH
uniref:KH domain-containing protein n=1 Tax=Panagrellus redivivus TaxID=6233 RepID=A0A7E4VP68_PANRE